MQYEVEIKCLVESKEKAGRLPDDIRKLGYELDRIDHRDQLMGYYVEGDISKLVKNVEHLIKPEELKVLQNIVAENTTFSVRDRQSNEKVLFIIKATKGESPNHATQRVEFEAQVQVSLEELIDTILSAGYKLQARWEAHRTIYRVSNGITFETIFSPGYGYMAELELVVEAKDQLTNAETRVRDFARELGLEQVDPHRIERMFKYYNAHWQEYYGTKKVFTVK